MIRFEREICTNLEAAASREWLETNGIGGYASGTVAGINTRRYHGLLVAAATPPTGRTVLLSKFEETLIVDGRRFELSANQYPNAVYPNGYKFLKEFRLAPFPVWVYQIEDIEIEKTVFMPHGENSTVVEYKFKVQSSRFKVNLELKPLLAFRDYHHLRREEESFETDFRVNENFVSVRLSDEIPRLLFAYENGKVEKTGFWYRNFEYERERERGFDFRENLFQPFVLRFDVESEKAVSVVVSTEIRDAADAEKFKQTEIERRENLIEISGYKDEFLQQLVLAADQFIVSREGEKSVIAGYPWFSDWGRDTMIALPGLTLATNCPDIARSIILEFSRHISQGMLPNRFPDVGETPEYNTVDATLWYFEAIRSFVEKTGDYDFVRENLYESLSDIIAWHLRGTRFNIHVDTDGLLYAGDETTQLTWMDAKSGDTVFTPRFGKAVEIQALWYNALRVMENLAARFEDEAERAQYAAMADLAELSFNQSFWNDQEECLFDCINGGRDASVRPNQIFAVSLKHALITGEKARKVVEKVERELLTPVGLRSLSPKDANYCPRYEGDGFRRDSAYHQGTIWSWLAGAFWTARGKVFPNEPQKFQDWLENFKGHLSEAGVGQISEIFDAEAPHAPRGCIAQAWSVAEILRAARENNNATK
ncbi:MAG TPA: amylo-alpha-1,6-glucosidase [Pyrinomonadaceae bacterium]|jgi:predicted glycogen debranching enzyme